MGPHATPTSCSPTPTCFTTRCCPATRVGRPSCGALDFVVIDEMHHYRGLFGGHVSASCVDSGASRRATASTPTFLLASATASDPEDIRPATHRCPSVWR